MKVGGRDFNLTRQEVESLMRNQTPESIQKYAVEVNGTVFPPKQVLGHITKWPRTSYTTMEAQRVLTKIGFVCRVARDRKWEITDGGGQEKEVSTADDASRIAALELALATAQAAINGLDARVRFLESAG